MFKVLDRDAANQEVATNKRAKQMFQRLWVAGTLGAFFTSLARTIPLDLRQIISGPVGLDGASNILLRYGYMIWLIWYFFLSNLRSQDAAYHPKVNEVPFDVVQSLVALIAGFYLGFLVAGQHGIEAFAVANLAIAVICWLAWYWFRGDKTKDADKKLQRHGCLPRWLPRFPRAWPGSFRSAGVIEPSAGVCGSR